MIMGKDTRRNFLKKSIGVLGAAGYGAVVAGGTTHAVDTLLAIQEGKEIFKDEIKKAEKILLDRLGFAQGKLEFDDHIASPDQTNRVLTGEVRPYDLHLSQAIVDVKPEESTWIGGSETASRKREQQNYDSVRTSVMAIATDAHLDYSVEYLKANAEASALREWYRLGTGDLAVLLTALAGAAAAVPEFNRPRIPYSLNLARRLFLKLGLVAGAGIVGTQATKKIGAQAEGPNLDAFDSLTQKFLRILPFDRYVELRNLIMTANMNSLSSVPLADFAPEVSAFAGGGHVQMAREILRSPNELAKDLYNFLLGRGEGKDQGVLYQLFALYRDAKNDDERQRIIAFTAIDIAGLFGNVEIRFNQPGANQNDAMKKDAKSLYNLQRQRRQAPESDSVFLTLTRAMEKLDQDLLAGKDPIISQSDSQLAWNFFRAVCEPIFKSKNAKYWSFDASEQCEFGIPVAFENGKEITRVFGSGTIAINRGFVTAIG